MIYNFYMREESKIQPFTHVGADIRDIASDVILCGDPLRVQVMVEKFIPDATLVSTTRGNKVYTGAYKGHPVSILASFMGVPSMGIYSYELFDVYKVQNIIRLGTAGSVSDLKIGDIVISSSCLTDSNYMDMRSSCEDTTLYPSENLKKRLISTATDLSYTVHTGKIYCTDTFYASDEKNRYIASAGCVAVEMESAALYYNAHLFEREAITVCTISDEIATGEKLTSQERMEKTEEMFLIALEMLCKN